jgi:NADH-quinone oxidoreductase subunit G
LAREDGNSIFNAVRALAEGCNVIREDWNGLNMLHYAAARVGGLDLGFLPSGKDGLSIAGMVEKAGKGELDVLYLLGADELDPAYFGNAFVIYQGHHGDVGAHRADVVLPAAAYTEKDGIYTNTEGRPQRAQRAIFPVGDAREDWKILRALSAVMGAPLPYDTLEQLREKLFAAVPHLHQMGEIVKAEYKPLPAKQPKSYRIKKQGFEPVVLNFYMTDPISRASKTMAACMAEISQISGASASAQEAA